MVHRQDRLWRDVVSAAAPVATTLHEAPLILGRLRRMLADSANEKDTRAVLTKLGR